jgi:hypothetical protein
MGETRFLDLASTPRERKDKKKKKKKKRERERERKRKLHATLPLRRRPLFALGTIPPFGVQQFPKGFCLAAGPTTGPYNYGFSDGLVVGLGLHPATCSSPG